MARADSHDLRVRVLEAVATGMSRRQAAARYRIGVATVIRWAALAAVTGETKAKRQGRPRGSKLDAHEAFLLALIDGTDDITLAEMQARLRTERDVLVGLGTLWRFFDGRAINWKKLGRQSGCFVGLCVGGVAREVRDGSNPVPNTGSRAGAAPRPPALPGLRRCDADPLREPPHPGDAVRHGAAAPEDPAVRG